MDDAEASKAAGAKLLAACKKATDPARDLTGTPGEAAWLANGKVCPCEACTLAREVVAGRRYADQEVHLDLRRRRLGL